MLEIRFFKDHSVDDKFVSKKLRELNAVGNSPIVKTEREITNKDVILRFIDGEGNYNSKADVSSAFIDSVITKMENNGVNHKETVDV